MIRLFKKKKSEVKNTSWETMSIATFKAMCKINASDISEEDKVFHIAALLNGMTYDEFLELPIDEARSLIAKQSFLYTEPKPEKVKRLYHLGTRDYKMMKNTDGMTTAAYINYQSIVGIPIEESIDDLMTIILIPDGKVYGDYDTEEIKEEIANNLSVPDALGIANFFTRCFERSMKRIVRWSEAAMTTLKIMGKKKNKEALQAEKIALQTAIDELHSMHGFHL